MRAVRNVTTMPLCRPWPRPFAALTCGPLVALVGLLTVSCGADDAPADAPRDASPGAPDARHCDTPDAALATCLAPTRPAAYYVEQSLKYFDTLDVSADASVVPAYSDLVARWEWPPWLKLTGYGRDVMISSDELVKEHSPSTVPTRDCRFFATQPFARCRVVFSYDGGPCPIYEEFTFNDAGEMTFIEAWTDTPALLPFAADDPWGEGPSARRLATRVPGLGSPTGRIDPTGAPMAAAGATDPEIADFAERARDFWGTWFAEVKENGKDIYARGCGW